MCKIRFDDKIWCEDDTCQEEGESVFKWFSRFVLDHVLATHLETTELFITCLAWNSVRNSTSQIKELKQRLVCENVYKNVQDCKAGMLMQPTPNSQQGDVAGWEGEAPDS